MYNAESALEPVGTTLHQPPAAAADSPPLLLPPCHNTECTGPCGCSSAAGEPGRCERIKRGRKRSRDFQEPGVPSSHLNISSRACQKLHTSTHTFRAAQSAQKPQCARTHAYTRTYTRERGARMNTQRTGVPGAGLFSEQSDIYRKGKEGRRGRKRWWWLGGEEEEEEREVCYDSSGSD